MSQSKIGTHLVTPSLEKVDLLDLLMQGSSPEEILALPWEDGVITTVKRPREYSGCTGCLVRRLIATTSHKNQKIQGVDTLLYQEEGALLRAKERASHYPPDSTLCLFFSPKNDDPLEFHLLPVPGCSCQNGKSPPISQALAEKSMQQWPNVLLNCKTYKEQIGEYHLKVGTLPNTGILFCEDPKQSPITLSIATAADFRDTSNLRSRLVGEAVERYSAPYIPHGALFSDSELKEPLNGDKSPQKSLWTDAYKFDGTKVAVKADTIFSGLHLRDPKNFSPLSSSGLAAHKTIHDALLSAALEAVEREALLVAWRSATIQGSPLFTYLPESLLQNSAEVVWIKMLLNKQPGTLSFLGVHNPFQLPQVLIIHIPDKTTAPLFGSGIGVSVESALHKALCELLQGLSSPEQPPLEREPKHFKERPRFWASSKQKKLLQKRLTPLDKLGQMIPKAPCLDLDLFSQNEPELYYREITPPDIALTGWHVVRVAHPFYEPFVGSSSFERPSLLGVNQFLTHCNLPPVTSILLDPYPYP